MKKRSVSLSSSVWSAMAAVMPGWLPALHRHLGEADVVERVRRSFARAPHARYQIRGPKGFSPGGPMTLMPLRDVPGGDLRVVRAPSRAADRRVLLGEHLPRVSLMAALVAF